MMSFYPGLIGKHFNKLILAAGLLATNAAWAQVPQITSFSPASGTIGTSVTISGTNFGTTPASNTVYFGSVKATVTTATATSLTVTVPVGATFSPLTVTSGSLTTYATKPFVVTYSQGAISNYLLKKDFVTKSASSVNAKNTTLADLNGDGKTDLITNNFHGQTLSIFKNASHTPGILSLSTPVEYSAGAEPSNVSTGDLDNDGKLDLIIPNFEGSSFSIRRNVSTADSIILGSETKFNTYPNPRLASVFDIDGDGKLDVAIVSEGYGIIEIFRNTTSGTTISFSTSIYLSAGSNARDLRFADLDGDGKTDLICTNFGSGTVSVYRNTSNVGSISFSSSSSAISATSPRSSTIADFDGDGKLDIATADYGNSAVYVVRNSSSLGSISFGSSYYFNNIASAYGITAGDIDGDGKIDLIVGNNTNAGGLTILKNNTIGSNVSFSKSYFQADSGTTFVTIGDLDQDNFPELIASNYFKNTISILSQRTSVLPVKLISFSGNPDHHSVKLEWSAASEINVEHYIVEKEFYGTFDSIGIVRANASGKYSFSDNAASETAFYRLKIVDKDGNSSFSDVIKVISEMSTADLLSIFPNPSSSYITVKHPLAAANAIISIFDLYGREVVEVKISEGSVSTVINTSTLVVGTYTVCIANGNQKLTSKFIKE